MRSRPQLGSSRAEKLRKSCLNLWWVISSQSDYVWKWKGPCKLMNNLSAHFYPYFSFYFIPLQSLNNHLTCPKKITPNKLMNINKLQYFWNTTIFVFSVSLSLPHSLLLSYSLSPSPSFLLFQLRRITLNIIYGSWNVTIIYSSIALFQYYIYYFLNII